MYRLIPLMKIYHFNQNQISIDYKSGNIHSRIFFIKQLPLTFFFIYYIIQQHIIEKIFMSTDDFVNSALKERESAKAFFSSFKVGAILVCNSDKTYSGCNIEISSYSLTICAERVAIFKAVSEGEKNFKSIFIASDSEKLTPPCGACRQVLWELSGDIDVYMINKNGDYQMAKMSTLLPLGFDKTYFSHH